MPEQKQNYSAQKLNSLPLSQIDEPTNAMRSTFDEAKLHSLEESIRKNGLLSPILLKPIGERFEIIAGHRRFIAFQRLRKSHIPAIVLHVDEETLESMRYHENSEREEIDPVDEAIYLSKLKEKYKCTIVHLAGLTGKSKSYISERLQILDYDHHLLEALTAKHIPFSIARILNRCKDVDDQRELVKNAVRSGCTVRVASDWVNMCNSEIDYDVETLTQPSEETSEAPTTASQIMTVCSVCGETHPNNSVKLTYICTPCYSKIFP